MKKYEITHAIISTEPKAHLAYAKFLIQNNINILMDKPITSPCNVLNKVKEARKIEKEYLILAKLYQMHKDKIIFSIQCQRRFHIGYLYIKKLLKEVVSKYKIPITYIDIYHSDGMWNMPNEFLERENHPYKYGYGKLFHSGYHFVDLLTWILECNDSLTKTINNATIYSTTFRPTDFFKTIENDFYKLYLNTNKFENILTNPSFVKGFGELDFHAMIDFKQDNDILTHCSLNLMQTGFSKRAWTELPKDTYKANGRVRHERINIQVGPLLNIQIHSYQANEINDSIKLPKNSPGGIDHFDIYIFRNTKLIGGEVFEKVSLKDLDKDKDLFIGNNEKARERCFLDFINNNSQDSDLLKHQKSILLLTKLCESIASNRNIINFKWRDYEK